MESRGGPPGYEDEAAQAAAPTLKKSERGKLPPALSEEGRSSDRRPGPTTSFRSVGTEAIRPSDWGRTERVQVCAH